MGSNRQSGGGCWKFNTTRGLAGRTMSCRRSVAVEGWCAAGSANKFEGRKNCRAERLYCRL